jgi:hypothetical protein
VKKEDKEREGRGRGVQSIVGEKASLSMDTKDVEEKEKKVRKSGMEEEEVKIG